MNKLKKEYAAWKFDRRKKRNVLMSIIYRFFIKMPLKHSYKFKIFADLAFIFQRMAYEHSNLDKHSARYLPYIKRNEFLRSLNFPDSYNAVEIGCGTGEYARAISKSLNSVVAIDQNKEILNLASSLTEEKNIKYINSEAFQWLAKSDQKYDVMILAHIIEHLDDPVAFLEKSKKLVKFIYIEVPDNDCNEFSFLREVNGMDPIFNDADHIWEFQRHELLKILDDLRLEILREEYIHGVMRFWLKTL